jgi:hypothetical protein
VEEVLGWKKGTSRVSVRENGSPAIGLWVSVELLGLKERGGGEDGKDSFT